MSHTRYLKALFNDLCSGWKPFELFWLAAFLPHRFGRIGGSPIPG